MRRKRVNRRRTSLKRIVLSLLVLLAVGIAGAGGAALWGMRAVEAPGPLEEATNVVIEHGQPTIEIGAVLEDTGVIADQRLFVLTTYLTRSAGGGPLKAGEYEFPAGASMAEVLSILRSGRAVVHKVTIPEGWTSAQVVERVNAHPALIGTISEVPPEGSLLPDTYVFKRGVEREVLLARMRDAQLRLLDELWETRDPDLPIDTPEEAIILASIVEKETGVAEERPEVAAVFVNRLRRNMRLQSDPTIIYGITLGEGPLDRPIRRSDISEETPYNTYRIDGLPPTPIANPGREAIAAVLQPGTTDHLYFVADGTGGHAFATTLDEHNENVRNWRKIEQGAASQSAPEDEDDEKAPTPVADGPEQSEAPDEPVDVDLGESGAADAADESPGAPADGASPEDASAEPASGAEASGVASPATAVATPTPPREETELGEDKAEDLVAAATAADEPAVDVPAGTPAGTSADENAQAPSQAATPQPVSQADVAARAVPIPRPKPQRN